MFSTLYLTTHRHSITSLLTTITSSELSGTTVVGMVGMVVGRADELVSAIALVFILLVLGGAIELLVVSLLVEFVVFVLVELEVLVFAIVLVVVLVVVSVVVSLVLVVVFIVLVCVLVELVVLVFVVIVVVFVPDTQLSVTLSIITPQQ